ncbi:hypothetical protein [Amycolatopsis sp. DG1A-15b]|uniref:hypothetical protein n=1 Tax=Amycolatopsis sp. DG1A-15b TaxID=3052846 RepID=UPI00255BF813|nr:hypothetical protein [Amycolatopsis sp. DG1A-15b]WIX91408.1 hypothetical protein QRY02_13645 [Amycolatopsis sp. DG1A-15b]
MPDTDDHVIEAGPRGRVLGGPPCFRSSTGEGFSGPLAGATVKGRWNVTRRSGQLEPMSHQSSPTAG